MFKRKNIEGISNLQTNMLNLYPTCFLFKLKGRESLKKEKRDG
jgi:hypothetical protein